MTNSEQQPSSLITFLLDRTHSAKITAKLLRELSVSVEVHKRHYLPDDPDPSWIVDASGRGWAIISGDKGIQYDGINRQAVVKARAKVFLLADTESRGAEWAASLVMARHKMTRIATENNGPFYCAVEKGKDDHVGKPEFLEGGGPISRIPITEPQMGVSGEKPADTKQEESLPRPARLPFDKEA